jgi:hypothetical protein
MDTELTDEETAKIWQDARATFDPTAPCYVDQVYRLVQEKMAHAIRMKDLRNRVDQEFLGALW